VNGVDRRNGATCRRGNAGLPDFDMGTAALQTFTSPVVLFFMLGLLAAFARSDLAIPEAIAKGMSLYLMAAIGMKGFVKVDRLNAGAVAAKNA